MSSDIAQQAPADKGGFCFSEDTKILVKRNNKEIYITVKEVEIGDDLGNNCGEITAKIQMNGTDIPLYNLNGILVSGSHLVLGKDGIWKAVAEDNRSVLTNITSNILYCFNTTTHKIPIYASEIESIIYFKDWEEIEENDTFGQYFWTYTVLKYLNKYSNYSKWNSSIKVEENIPLMGSKIKVKTKDGFIDISNIKLNDKVLDKYGNEQEVLGITQAKVDSIEDTFEWNTELYELDHNIWVKGKSNIKNTFEDKFAIGYTLITKTGEFIIWDTNKRIEKIVRDFTEIGYSQIYKTYPLVASRLRLSTPEII
jgi:hypothetical protein